jgi:Zn-finger nucleic acid-binding protein
MHIEVIFCPACNHKLRVPEDLMGRPVQCPQCKGVFVAPPPMTAITDRPPESVPADATQDTRQGLDDDWSVERRQRPVSGKIAPAAICLMLTALGHLGLNIWGVIQAATQPEMLRKQVQAFAPGIPMPFDIARLSLIACSAFALVSLFQAFCGFAMFSRRSYSLAICGAVLSLANCNQLCCFGSIPVGIWALIVLFQSDVRGSFR